MASDDDPADQLYRLPLADFVAARNALAKELTAAGDREGGRAVRALKKPSVTAWALNRLAQDQPEEVAALLQAGDAVRSAQQQALAGDASGLRAASQNLQAVVTRLTEAAAGNLDAPDPQRDRIRDTLRAAAVEEEAGQALRRGRLVEELTPAGFGLGLGVGDAMAVAAGPKATRRGARGATGDGKAAAKAAEAERLRIEAARAEARRLRADADRLAVDADRLATEADRAQEMADAARQAAAEAAARADEAEAMR